MKQKRKFQHARQIALKISLHLLSDEQILRALAGGVSRQELLDEYPQLEPEDIEAALLYAALPIKIAA